MRKNIKYAILLILIPFLIIGTAKAATVLFPYQGGLGTGTVPTSGQIPIGTSGGIYSPATLTAGSNITITNGSGTITIASTGGGSGTPGGVNGQLQYNNSGSFGGASMFYYDDVANRVGIGENSPTAVLEVTTAGGSDPYFMISSATAGDIFSVDNNGDVGIGDTTPDYKLEVLSTSTQFTLTNVDTTQYAEFFVNSSGDLDIKPSGGNITFNNAYTFPSADGSASQFLQTNGSGTLTWASPAGSGDMTKAVYDIGANNIVDSAEDLNCTNCINATEIEDIYVLNTSDTMTGTLTVTTMTDGTLYAGYGEITGATSITSTLFIGALTGNASTATALANNPSDCGAGVTATAIDASGNLTCGIDPIISTEIDTSSELTTILTDEDGTGTCGTGAICIGGHGHPTTELSGVNAGTDLTADLEEEAHCTEHDSTDVDCTGETIIVVDDQHNHTTTTISGIDISDDTNLSAGTYLDISGDGLAFDPTEITGGITWDDSGEATVVWGWALSGATDPQITFGNDLMTLANGLTLTTGNNFIIGTTTWNSADEIDGTKIKDADYGDVVIDINGDWQVSEATALAADPANCASSGLAGGITAAGVAEACITPNAGTNIANDLEEEITEGSLADSTILSADIKDGEIAENDLTASFVFDDGDLFNFSSISVTASTEGIILPQHATTCTATTAEGQICWENDADKLWIGDGASPKEILTVEVGDVSTIGDCATGACFDGTQGTILTFNNAGGDGTVSYNGDFSFNKQVGIGDTSPDAVLEITTISTSDIYFMVSSDTEANGDVFKIDNSKNITSGGTYFYGPSTFYLSDGVNNNLYWSGSDTYVRAVDDVQIIADGNPGDIILTAELAKLTWTGDGNLGINDTSPDYSLEVIDTTTQFTITNVDTSVYAEFFVNSSGDLSINSSGGDLIIEGDLRILGDDLFATTNTLGAIWVGDGTNYNPVVMSGDCSIIANGTVDCALDISDDTNLAAGRSLTLSGDSVEADAELYTDTKCIYFEDPVAADDFKSIWYAKQATTVTSIWCESDQTVTAMLQVDDGSPADMDSVDLTCDATPPEDTSLDGDATLAAGDRVDLDVASVASTPTWVSICFTFTSDD